MKGVISVLLSSDKRMEVSLVECYQGLRLFQLVSGIRQQKEKEHQDVLAETYSMPQHAPKRTSGVRELSLK